MWWNKKQEQKEITKIQLIQEVRLTKGGKTETHYFTTVNGTCITNSYFLEENEKEKAEQFFNSVVKCKGKTTDRIILKEVTI